MKNFLIPVGDKVLIEPEESGSKTDSGLYLPQGVKEKDSILLGRITKVGPGYPVPDPTSLDEEPWMRKSGDKYFPLQAKERDRCIFLKEQGVEIIFENKKYFVVPQSAILVLIRDTSD
ncbi:MAG: co-chaperone GroES [Candidatus Omnitrophica bacterium]|jgi:co-chaperonin GroES (HSP10)|nr:co-chaperone GroES [Candidatus Omnitrophota bacterium]